MDNQVLKTVRPYEGLVLQIIGSFEDEYFEIVVNGKTKDIQHDWNRALESLDSFNH